MADRPYFSPQCCMMWPTMRSKLIENDIVFTWNAKSILDIGPKISVDLTHFVEL